MTWGFIWLMFILKIPIVGLFGIVWWALKQGDETPQEPARVQKRPHPRRPLHPGKRRPRGPHGGESALPAPSRVRPVTAIGPALAAREHQSPPSPERT